MSGKTKILFITLDPRTPIRRCEAETPKGEWRNNVGMRCVANVTRDERPNHLRRSTLHMRRPHVVRTGSWIRTYRISQDT